MRDICLRLLAMSILAHDVFVATALAAAGREKFVSFEIDVHDAAHETERLQDLLSDRCGLTQYADCVRSVGGTNVWTDALQKALDEHEIVRIPPSDDPYYIDRSVIVPSNRRIEASGAIVRLLPGVRTLLLRNRNTRDGTLTPIRAGDRDRNIAIIGGRWEDWWTHRAGHESSGRYDPDVWKKGRWMGVSTLFFFNNCDHLTIRDATFHRTSGFAVQTGDGDAHVYHGIRFDRCFADGLHLNGNLSRVWVKDVVGDVGDDLVALNAYDWLNSSVNFGPQRQILCEDLELKPRDGKSYPAIRIQPAKFRYADGSIVDCAISEVVFRRVKGIRTFKMYLQTPRYEIGTEPEWSSVGSGGDLHFEDIEIDLTAPIDVMGQYATSEPVRGHFGAFEFGANLKGVHFRNIGIRFHADRHPLSHLITVGPKSCTIPGAKGRIFEVFDPYVDCRVENVTIENVRTTGAVPTELVHATTFDDVNGDGRSSGRGTVIGLRIDGRDWTDLNARARKASSVPIRPGGVDGAPFWNHNSRAFMNPPAFDFKAIEGAAKYRFTVIEKSGGKRTQCVLSRSTAALTPIWESIRPGYVTVMCEGLSSDGAVLGFAGTRECYRAAIFKGPYPEGLCDYRQSAKRVYTAVFNLPHVQAWLTKGEPPKGYDLYCYPAKIMSSIIRALCRHAKAAPQDRASALTIARKMADWLIAQSQPSDAPLANWPPTYWGDDQRRASARFKGQQMLLYPAHAANAYFDLAEMADEVKYREAALAIARTYVRLQAADGTWPCKVYEKDGQSVQANRLVPSRYAFRMFDIAHALTGDETFKATADKAFDAILKGACVTWNWDGQFEDIDPLPPYQNLQKGSAVDTANRLFAQKGDNELARELVAWCEDQFVVWSDPIHHMDWKNWKMPTALEQYEYYTPIDASMGDMIGAYATAYAKTHDELYLVKAKALADNITRHQRDDGTIPTYFDSRGGSDWMNCMVYVADRLELLADVCESDE